MKTLGNWKREKDLNAAKLVADLKSKVDNLYSDDDATTEEIWAVLKELTETLMAEEQFWKQQNIVFWPREGDLTTKFFHAITKQRRFKNKIMSLLNFAGSLAEDEEKLVAIDISYFRDLFTTSNPELIDEALANVTTTIYDRLDVDLTSLVSEWEVNLARFAMHPEKTPGPDGPTSLFYQ